MKNSSNHVLIIASGGIDSTACINYYNNLNFNIELLFFDFGQLARKQENKAVTAIANYYEANLTKIKITGQRLFGDGLIVGRNAAFLFLALMNFKAQYGIIATGIHYGTGYFDCSEKFLAEIQGLIDQYSGSTIKVEAPFVNFTKPDIVDYCLKEKVPLALTYSCELGLKQPCGKCATCKDLIAIYDRKKYPN